MNLLVPIPSHSHSYHPSSTPHSLCHLFPYTCIPIFTHSHSITLLNIWIFWRSTNVYSVILYTENKCTVIRWSKQTLHSYMHCHQYSSSFFIIITQRYYRPRHFNSHVTNPIPIPVTSPKTATIPMGFPYFHSQSWTPGNGMRGSASPVSTATGFCQWERVIFDLLQNRHPSTDHQKLSQVITTATPTAVPSLVYIRSREGLLGEWVKYNNF